MANAQTLVPQMVTPQGNQTVIPQMVIPLGYHIASQHIQAIPQMVTLRGIQRVVLQMVTPLNNLMIYPQKKMVSLWDHRTVTPQMVVDPLVLR